MNNRIVLALIALLLTAGAARATEKSDRLKPRWMTSSLPVPKSAGYIFISAQGSGRSLEEAKQMAIVNLTSKLEHERGLVINSHVKVEKRGDRNTTPQKRQEFTLEASEKGKQINLTCRVVDEYWERDGGKYLVTELYTVNDNAQPDKGSYCDNITLTTSYGAAPMFYSLIPGVGQFTKGSNLKEISYIHAEGYPAAEMKHGPIALIDSEMPTVIIAPKDHLYEKIVSNVQQVKSRGGSIIAIVTKGDTVIRDLADHVLEVPDVPECLTPLITSIPLQLLSYYIAINKGKNVDMPRNLAKSVTVE